MSANLPPIDGDIGDHDLLAAEYVLGLLQPEALRQAQARFERDPAFAAEVDMWETRFAPWLAAIPPVAVPDETWARIRTTLWQHELPERAARPALARRSLWNSMPFWRGLAAGGFAVAAASVAALLLTTQRLPAPVPAPSPVVVAPTPATPIVVSLRNDDGTTAYTATIDAANGTLTLVPVQLGGDPSLSPELWLIPAGGQPHSLGMVDRAKAMLISIPASLRSAAGADSLFAISLEPAGSSAHQAPTGPVVAKGSGMRL
jgi:anti-sigma-K factor RskA